MIRSQYYSLLHGKPKTYDFSSYLLTKYLKPQMIQEACAMDIKEMVVFFTVSMITNKLKCMIPNWICLMKKSKSNTQNLSSDNFSESFMAQTFWNIFWILSGPTRWFGKPMRSKSNILAYFRRYISPKEWASVKDF